jgi:RNA polymerase sigma-70 factor (ECF subfamily)
MQPAPSRQEELYQEAAEAHSTALVRLARSYELDPDKRRDLLQEIHLALWRSFVTFDGRCSLRSWVYRIAHNVATSHVLTHRRLKARALVGLDEIATLAADVDTESAVSRQQVLDQLHALIHRLTPAERQVILLYLEGLDAAAIGDITGLSPRNVATRVHRIKKVLTVASSNGARNDE